jgi:hypothetical protein
LRASALLPALVLSGLLASPLPAAGQDADDPAHPPIASPSVARAAPLNGSISVDGRLDEAAWEQAPLIQGFVQREPREGIPAEHDTQVRVLVAEDALYIGALLLEPEPDRIADQLVRRGEEGQFDYFEVAFDTDGDGRSGYRFRVSAAGVQTDEFLYEDDEVDGTWAAVWESAVGRDPRGWTVEMRIPLSQLRFRPAAGEQRWGVNFSRRRLATNEISDFALESRRRGGIVSQFGTLEGLELPAAPRRIELRPYALARATTVPPEDRSPLRDATETGRQMGADLRYGLGGSFTLDVTLNPDFGQVESDPAEINLTAFETFFDEQRPFFVEDARVLDFSLAGRNNALFYSRRIGSAPSGGAPPGAEHHRVPDAARILGAAKLTGRTRGGTSVGGLVAATEAVDGRAWPGAEGSEGTRRFLAEPAARFGVARVIQDYGNGAGQVGAIVSGMTRDLPGDRSFHHLPSSAMGMGLDFEHTWNDREWALMGHVGMTRVHGDSTALIRLQRSSNHYRQRPDAPHLSVDSTLTSMTGTEWRLELARRSGQNWTGRTWATRVGPGLEGNDFGFTRTSERLDGGGQIQYQEVEPGRYFRSYRFNLFTFHHFSHQLLEGSGADGSWRDAYVTAHLSTSGNFTLHNNWQVEVGTTVTPPTMSRSATRGGPLMQSPGALGGEVGFATDRRRAVSLAPSVEVRRRARDAGRELTAAMEVRLRPSPRLEIQLEPQWERTLDGAQYVATAPHVPREGTYGATYLFGRLHRSELSMETRLNLTFTPNLTLQLFAQPLLSSGDFQEYRILERARSYDLEPLAEGTPAGDGCSGGRTCLDADGTRRFDLDGDGQTDLSLADRDFNIRSLIGNLVLRWEYRPGSTLFLVWQHHRSHDAPVGDFRFRRDVDALTSAAGTNALILKVNYWLSP